MFQFNTPMIPEGYWYNILLYRIIGWPLTHSPVRGQRSEDRYQISPFAEGQVVHGTCDPYCSDNRMYQKSIPLFNTMGFYKYRP